MAQMNEPQSKRANPHRVIIRRESGSVILDDLRQPFTPLPDPQPGKWLAGHNVKLPDKFTVYQDEDRTEIVVADDALLVW